MRRKSGSMAVRNFLSLLSRVLSGLPSRLTNGRRPGTLLLPPRASCGTSAGLSRAELNVRLSPPPGPPLALPVPPNTHAAAAGVRPVSWQRGQAPSLALLPSPGFSVASCPRPLLMFFIWILSRVHLSFLVPWL